MADWSGLRDALAEVPDQVTYAWSDLDALVGGLPPSAYEYPAFWSGKRAKWPGFRTINVRVGDSITFVRTGERPAVPRLAWHSQRRSPRNHTTPPNVAAPDVTALVEQLTDTSTARTPEQFLATGGTGLQSPGLYSWWVDRSGADDLTRGLGHTLGPGLIYAGLAGATRSRSRRRSNNTLWGRISSMHLGGNHNLSTFRRSLGSMLANAAGQTDIDEDRLTSWMHHHLRVITVAVAVADADTLNDVETAVLNELDPPLNLAKMSRTATRTALTKLRRAHSRS